MAPVGTAGEEDEGVRAAAAVLLGEIDCAGTDAALVGVVTSK